MIQSLRGCSDTSHLVCCVFVFDSSCYMLTDNQQFLKICDFQHCQKPDFKKKSGNVSKNAMYFSFFALIIMQDINSPPPEAGANYGDEGSFPENPKFRCVFVLCYMISYDVSFLISIRFRIYSCVLLLFLCDYA